MTLQILVVDDKIDNLNVIETFLDDKNMYNLTLTQYPEKGLEILNSDKKFDLILLDKMMPNINGIEFLSKMKENPKLANIPVIMQTAASSKEEMIEGIKARVYYYLIKPYQEEVLRSLIDAAIQDYNKQKSLRENIQQHKKCMEMITDCRWEIKTIYEATELATFISGFFKESEQLIIGIYEMLLNAVEHGNLSISYKDKSNLQKEGKWEEEINRRLKLDKNKDKKVIVSYKKFLDNAQITIKDEGKGFNWKEFLDFDPARVNDNHGRGIAISNNLSFSNIEYIGSGNEVVCTIKINSY